MLQNASTPSSACWRASSSPELRMPGWEVRSSVDGELLRFLSQRMTRPELPFKVFSSEPFVRQRWIGETARVETPLGTAVKTPESWTQTAAARRERGQCTEQSSGVTGQKSKRPCLLHVGLGPKALGAEETSVQSSPPLSHPEAMTRTFCTTFPHL